MVWSELCCEFWQEHGPNVILRGETALLCVVLCEHCGGWQLTRERHAWFSSSVSARGTDTFSSIDWCLCTHPPLTPFSTTTDPLRACLGCLFVQQLSQTWCSSSFPSAPPHQQPLGQAQGSVLPLRVRCPLLRPHPRPSRPGNASIPCSSTTPTAALPPPALPACLLPPPPPPPPPPRQHQPPPRRNAAWSGTNAPIFAPSIMSPCLWPTPKTPMSATSSASTPAGSGRLGDPPRPAHSRQAPCVRVSCWKLWRI